MAAPLQFPKVQTPPTPRRPNALPDAIRADPLSMIIASVARPVLTQFNPSSNRRGDPTEQKTENLFSHRSSAGPNTAQQLPQTIDLRNFLFVKRDRNILHLAIPNDPSTYLVDMRLIWVYPWIKFVDSGLVVAPNPNLNHQYCVGKMLTVDRDINFESPEVPDEVIPYMKIEFSSDPTTHCGFPPSTVFRGNIWPV